MKTYKYKNKEYVLIKTEEWSCEGCCFFNKGEDCKVLEDDNMDCTSENGIFKEVLKTAEVPHNETVIYNGVMYEKILAEDALCNGCVFLNTEPVWWECLLEKERVAKGRVAPLCYGRDGRSCIFKKVMVL